jgi:predicted NUDIX family phosphoesterase
MGEQILVFPRKELDKIGDFQGFVYNTPESRYRELLDPDKMKVMDRDKAETNPKFKQIIPYCMIVNEENKFLVFERGKTGGESRLVGRLSLGIGGHLGCTELNYEDGLMRELEEELSKLHVTSSKLIGFLNDDSDEVGKVHFGVVHLFFINGKVKALEECIKNPQFLTAEEVKKRIVDFENWSQILIREQF